MIPTVREICRKSGVWFSVGMPPLNSTGDPATPTCWGWERVSADESFFRYPEP